MQGYRFSMEQAAAEAYREVEGDFGIGALASLKIFIGAGATAAEQRIARAFDNYSTEEFIQVGAGPNQPVDVNEGSTSVRTHTWHPCMYTSIWDEWRAIWHDFHRRHSL